MEAHIAFPVSITAGSICRCVRCCYIMTWSDSLRLGGSVTEVVGHCPPVQLITLSGLPPKCMQKTTPLSLQEGCSFVQIVSYGNQVRFAISLQSLLPLCPNLRLWASFGFRVPAVDLQRTPTLVVQLSFSHTQSVAAASE